MIASLVCALLVLTGVFSILTNRDLFSPGKFYLVSFLLFYVGALNAPGDYELWLLILLVLLIGVATVCLEAKAVSGRARAAPMSAPAGTAAASTRAQPLESRARARERNVAFWVWLASLPAIASQIYIVRMFNGIEGYFAMLGNRVIELRGLGWAKTLIATLVVLNLIYFAVGLTRRRSVFWWSAFVAHLLLVIAVGALSGSRSSILSVFAIQLFIYHYLRRPVKAAYALPVGALLVALAMVIGVVRSGLSLDDDSAQTGFDASKLLSTAAFNYGVNPLQILLNADHLQLAGGSTLISVLTNAVPRDWWPEKPDTGGVYFTKKYTDDAWDGTSNLTPTFLGEGVMNFGWLGGLGFFLAADLALMFWVVEKYKKMLAKPRAPPDVRTAIEVVTYVLVMWAAVALLAGEVTNAVQTLIFTQLLPALVLKLILTRASAWQRAPR